jgi:hypothetical protein
MEELIANDELEGCVRKRSYYKVINTPPPDRSTQPSIQWVAESLSPEVKRAGREADFSLPSSAEARNEELYLHPAIIFMA